MGLITLYEKWSKIYFIDLAEQTLLEMDEFIAELNRKQMYDKGVRADGSEITPEYSGLTEFFKRQKGQIVNHVTLKDSGDFHKSIFADIYSSDLVLDATDKKTNSLLEKYGEVLGLTEESLMILQNEFRPRYVKNIEKALQ
ncbi:MAG: hypothetical protein GY679_00100 [Mycoplasma sp.]|nr:hypothetical protein [Mycoplasma sp.]